MLQASTLKFLTALKKNNNKPWFDEHKKEFETAKKDVEALVGKILQQLAKEEPGYGELDPKKCVFRIYRDVRFSKDKTPYKTHFGAYFVADGNKDGGPGYYLHVEPGATFIAGGYWIPQPDALKKIRQEIDYNFADFKKVVEDKKFKKVFGVLNEEEKLKTPPKGYDAENPAIEYLKLKSFTVSAKLEDSDVTGKAFEKKIVDVFGSMKSFIEFLKMAVA